MIVDSSGGVVTNRIRARQVKEQGGSRNLAYSAGVFWVGQTLFLFVILL